MMGDHGLSSKRERKREREGEREYKSVNMKLALTIYSNNNFIIIMMSFKRFVIILL